MAGRRRRQKRQRGTTPGLVPWALASISILLLTAVSLISLFVSAEFKKTYAYEHITEEASKGVSFRELESEVIDFVETPVLLELRDQLLEVEPNMFFRQARLGSIQILFMVHERVVRRDYRKGLKLFSTLTRRQVLSMINALGTDSSARERTEALPAQLEELADARGKLRTRERKLDENQAVIKRLVTTFNLFGEDFADIMSLDLDESDEDELRYYTAGILKSLPKLVGLPDNIESIQALAESYRRYGTRPPFNEAGSGEALFERLNNIKNESVLVVTDYEKTMQEGANLQAEIDREKKLIASLRSPVLETLRASLLLEESPELSPLAEYVRSLVRSFDSKYL